MANPDKSIAITAIVLYCQPFNCLPSLLGLAQRLFLLLQSHHLQPSHVPLNPFYYSAASGGISSSGMSIPTSSKYVYAPICNGTETPSNAVSKDIAFAELCT